MIVSSASTQPIGLELSISGLFSPRPAPANEPETIRTSFHKDKHTLLYQYVGRIPLQRIAHSPTSNYHSCLDSQRAPRPLYHSRRSTSSSADMSSPAPVEMVLPPSPVNTRSWWKSPNLRKLNILLLVPLLSIFSQG